jgi:hypothetical protein
MVAVGITMSRSAVYDSVERKTFKTAPENVALEKDFNTIDIEGHEPDAFEKAMATIESDIGPALLRIAEVKSLKDEKDKELLLNLIALLHVRNLRLFARPNHSPAYDGAAIDRFEYQAFRYQSNESNDSDRAHHEAGT